MIDHIRTSCCFSSIVEIPTMIHFDNTTCIDQLKGYIKSDNIKHFSPQLFFTHQQQQHQKIEVKQIRSHDNLANLFTKSLPKSIFQKLVHGIRFYINFHICITGSFLGKFFGTQGEYYILQYTLITLIHSFSYDQEYFFIFICSFC